LNLENNLLGQLFQDLVSLEEQVTQYKRVLKEQERHKPSNMPYYKQKTAAMTDTLVDTFNINDRSHESYMTIVDAEVATMNMTPVEIKAKERISLEEVRAKIS